MKEWGCAIEVAAAAKGIQRVRLTMDMGKKGIQCSVYQAVVHVEPANGTVVIRGTTTISEVMNSNCMHKT